jgi:PEGA domain-containing protein
MRRGMRWISSVLAVLLVGGFLLSAAPGASAQVRRRVVVVEPFYPYYAGWGWGYGPYGYPGYYAPVNYGELKIETHRKDLAVYIDGGYAAEIKKDKKFTLKPGNHEIELRDSEGQTVYEEQVAVTVGKTTKLHVS